MHSYIWLYATAILERKEFQGVSLDLTSQRGSKDIPLQAHAVWRVGSIIQEANDTGTWRPTEKGRVPLSQFLLLGWLKMPCGLHMSTCSKQRRPAWLLSDRSARGVTCALRITLIQPASAADKRYGPLPFFWQYSQARHVGDILTSVDSKVQCTILL